VKYDYTLASAVVCSNIPVTVAAGKGLKFGSLTSTQLAAALALAQAALSTTGYTLFSEIRAADDVLASVNSLIRDSGSLYAVEDRWRVLRRRGGDRLDV